MNICKQCGQTTIDISVECDCCLMSVYIDGEFIKKARVVNGNYESVALKICEENNVIDYDGDVVDVTFMREDKVLPVSWVSVIGEAVIKYKVKKWNKTQ